MTYKHISKNGKSIIVSDQVKNIVDYTISRNKKAKDNIDYQKKDKIRGMVDNELYKMGTTKSLSMGRVPRLK